MAHAGILEGLPPFDLGLGLDIRPALVGGFESPEPEASTDATGEVSLDVTKRLGGDSAASLTVNTDFAETEVDTRRTNLTRFPLFFPEKRSFFLEGADIFEFGRGLGEDVVPFFSRRIGLVEGTEVPIDAGLKLTGRAGATSLGGLVVHTRDVQGVAPRATEAVVRVRQNVLAESTLGFIGTLGDPLGRPGAWTTGVDFTYQTTRFHGDKNLAASAWGLLNGRGDLSGNKAAFGAFFDFPNDLWDCNFIFKQIGDGFDPSLGFVPRLSIRKWDAGCTYAPRPKNSFIRQMFHEFYGTLVTDLQGARESYRVFAAPINWRLESGDRFEFNVVPTGEKLAEPFEIADGITIPTGSYDWRRFRLEVESAAKRRLAGQLTWWFGGFYSGTLHTVEVEAAWNPSPIVTFTATGEYDNASLETGDFDHTLTGLTVRLNLSPDLQLDSFVQYDTQSRLFGSNTRLRWTFRPQGDLFVIYNHNLRRPEDRFQRDSNELLVKLQYTFRP